MPPLVVLQFDMRASPAAPDTAGERYRACLDMVRWADSQPVSVVGFSEHHNTEDGFLSAPLMMAMAAASVSRRVAVNVSALLLPLHDPLRVAEDIAVLDLVSGGRFMTTLGLGYREAEYRALGADWQGRGRVFDEKLTVLLQALGGEAFDYRGTRVQLNPAPARPPQALLCVGGNSPAAARRAARFGLMFAPPIDDVALQAVYDSECERLGFDSGMVIFPNEPALTLIVEDPDRAWAEYGQYFLYDALAYRRWQHASRRAYAESGADSLQGLREEGKYAFLSPEQAAGKINRKGSINLAPLCGGMPVAVGWRSLELFAEQVVPLLEQD
ncbi:MAG: LLM class flavin-dependent oxidoreductase [Halieaceae bacterium]|nr:LLM class flavin-dependent oxidoreductase [Halieaceae bacterium]